jgi:hypothetical protein
MKNLRGYAQWRGFDAELVSTSQTPPLEKMQLPREP